MPTPKEIERVYWPCAIYLFIFMNVLFANKSPLDTHWVSKDFGDAR